MPVSKYSDNPGLARRLVRGFESILVYFAEEMRNNTDNRLGYAAVYKSRRALEGFAEENPRHDKPHGFPQRGILFLRRKGIDGTDSEEAVYERKSGPV